MRGKDKRFLFYFNEHSGYRHHDQDRATLDRGQRDGKLVATFRCFEEYERAKSMTLRLKVENVMRDERFAMSVNGQPVAAEQMQVRYAANGRDTRVHTVTLLPYLEYEIALKANQLGRGENRLEVAPQRLVPALTATIQVRELELVVRYA